MKIGDTIVGISQRYNGDTITIDNNDSLKYVDTTIKSIKINAAEPRVYTTVGSETIDYTSTTTCSTNTKKDFENMFKQISDYKVYNTTTVVWFKDGTKATATCYETDNFDVENGIIACVLKRMFGDSYKKDVKNVIKAKQEAKKRQENAKKELDAYKQKVAKIEKRNKENKLRMQARYEAKLALAIEEEKKKLKGKKVLNESNKY